MHSVGNSQTTFASFEATDYKKKQIVINREIVCCVSPSPPPICPYFDCPRLALLHIRVPLTDVSRNSKEKCEWFSGRVPVCYLAC